MPRLQGQTAQDTPGEAAVVMLFPEPVSSIREPAAPVLRLEKEATEGDELVDIGHRHVVNERREIVANRRAVLLEQKTACDDAFEDAARVDIEIWAGVAVVERGGHARHFLAIGRHRANTVVAVTARPDRHRN